MKRVVFLAGIALMSLVIEKAYAQQGIGTLHPDKSAALEMVSTKRGLLIPRIDIPDLTAPAPVTNPAHSLLVFNTGASGTQEGFYYWNDDGTQTGVGTWIMFGESSAGSLDDINIIGGNNINVVETTTGNTTDYEISLEPGTTPGQLLVTVIDDTDPQNPTALAVWEDASEIFSEILEGANAVTLEPELDANNDPTGKMIIKLGGTLSETTEIRTVWDEVLNQAESSHTLAISDLETISEPNKIVVVETGGANDGVLRTLNRSFTQNIATSQLIDQLSGYSFYTQEININVDVNNLSSDINLTMPDPSSSEGQVINIRITDNTAFGEPDAYLNIYESDGVTLITHGSLPFQAWIFKSNGASWALAGRY